MDSFLALTGLGLWKEQQQIALKLHNSSPGESRYLYWALLSMIFQSPNRCVHDTEQQRNPILISVAHRCLQTLLNQNVKLMDSFQQQQLPLENSDCFWLILKVLEMVGHWSPDQDDSKIVGIGKLKFPKSLFKSSTSYLKSNQQQQQHQEEDNNNARTRQDYHDDKTLSSRVDSLSLTNLNHLIESRRPQLPEYVSIVREDYFEIFDSDLGKEMRKKYLHLELVWRQRAVEWANSNGLKEVNFRMKEYLRSGDRNWNTMTTLNQSFVNYLLELENQTSIMDEFKLLDDFYIELNANNQSNQSELERGYSLARIDLRCRFRDPAALKLNLHPLELDQVIYSYFDQFGEKTCCFDDLIPYIKSLTSEEATNLRSKLEQISTTTTATIVTSRSNQDSFYCESFLRRYINLEKIIQSVSSNTGDQQVIKATSLLKSYFRYLPLGDDLPATALQPADGLALLAAQTLIQGWKGSEGSVANLYKATFILETCLSKSSHQYQASSLLIRLHRLLGNGPRNLLLFTQYGIKHIQHDTLSHLGLDRCSMFYGSHTLPSGSDSPDCTTGSPLSVQDLIEYPALIYEYIEDDTLRWINNCYVSEKYIQVEDLHYFKHRINLSVQKKILRMERLRLQLFEKIRFFYNNKNNNDDDINKANGSATWDPNEIEMILIEILRDCQSTIDNRDFTVIPDCQPWSSSGTCHQTSLGPILGNRWLWIMGSTYARIIVPHLKIPDHSLLRQPDLLSECSTYEIELNQFSKTLAKLVLKPERHLLESNAQNLVDFFQRRNDELESLLLLKKSKQTSPSHSLAIIHNVYEGFCLFDFASRQFGRSTYPSNTKSNAPVTKTLNSIKNKILIKFKKLESLVHQLIVDLENYAQHITDFNDNNNSINLNKKMTCLFAASPENLSLWRDIENINNDDNNFGNEEKWKDFLLKTHSEQSQTIKGWHCLIQLVIKNYHQQQQHHH